MKIKHPKSQRMIIAALNRRLAQVGPVQLAKDTGVSRNQLYRISRGKDALKLSTAERIAAQVGLEIVIQKK